MKFRSLGKRALVKVVKHEEKTTSGIVLPDTAKEKPQTAEAVAVGAHEDLKVNTALYKGRAKLRLRFRKAARKSFTLPPPSARRTRVKSTTPFSHG